MIYIERFPLEIAPPYSERIGYFKTPKNGAIAVTNWPAIKIKDEEFDEFCGDKLLQYFYWVSADNKQTILISPRNVNTFCEILLERAEFKLLYETWWNKSQPKGFKALLAFFGQLLGLSRAKKNSNNFFVEISEFPFDMTNNNSEEQWVILSEK